MVATDVAARGLDIPSVDLVINYDRMSNSLLSIFTFGNMFSCSLCVLDVTDMRYYSSWR